jgi:hypothetical protein
MSVQTPRPGFPLLPVMSRFAHPPFREALWATPPRGFTSLAAAGQPRCPAAARRALLIVVPLLPSAQGGASPWEGWISWGGLG